MKRKSWINISFVGLGNIFNSFLGLLFLTAVAKSLDIWEFGKYALLTSLVVFFGKVTDFGTNSLYVARKNVDEKKLFSTKMVLFFVAFFLSIITLLYFNLFTFPLNVLFTLGLVAYTFNFYLFAIFQKRENYKKVVLINTLPATIKAVFAIIILLGVFDITLNTAFAIFSLSIFSSLLLGIREKAYRTQEKSLETGLIARAAPAGTAQLVNEGWPAISNSVAKLSSEFSGVGVFSLADKIANIFSLISLSIFTVLLPKNSKRKEQNLEYDIKETFTLAFGILFMSFGAVFLANILMPLIFEDKFIGTETILNLLIFSSALMAIATFMENYFYVMNKIKTLFYIAIAKLGTFAITSLLLIPHYELRGVAWARLITAGVTLLVTVSTMFYFKYSKKAA